MQFMVCFCCNGFYFVAFPFLLSTVELPSKCPPAFLQAFLPSKSSLDFSPYWEVYGSFSEGDS